MTTLRSLLRAPRSLLLWLALLLAPCSLLRAQEVISVPTVAALKSIDPRIVGRKDSAGTRRASVWLQGYWSARDGGGGLVDWVDGSTTTADDGVAFASSSGHTNGRWIRPMVGPYNPRMFGAKGDFSATTNSSGTDDTAAWRAMIAASAATGLGITGWPGNYRLTDTLEIPDGFVSSIELGNNSLAGGCVLYLDVTNKPLFRLLDPSRVKLHKIAAYAKPQNGWGYSDALAEPQRNTNAFFFDVVGWGTSLNIKDVDGFYFSGLIKSRFDTNLVSRTEARLFDNTIEDTVMRGGYRWLDLVGGSGSVWRRCRFQSSSGGTTNQTCESALVVGEFMNNELFDQCNIEWSGFTGPMLALTNAEVEFRGLHVEGVSFPYQASSLRWAIAQSGGSVVLRTSRIQDLRSDWGSVTKFALVSLAGSAVTSLALHDSVIERWNEVAGYQFHRYFDYNGGAAFLQVNQLNDRDVGWATNSPSWYGFDERSLLAGKRLENRSDFGAGLDGWTVSYAGSPTAYSYLTSLTNAPGVLRINTGTTNLHATVLRLPYAGTFTASAVQRMKVRFKLPAVASSSTDDFRLRIGFMNDVSGSPGTDPTDGVFVYMSRTSYGDNRLSLMSMASSSATSSTLITSANFVAGDWYEVELIINNDGTQTRALLNPRTSSNSANVTATIPTASTALYPTVQFIKRGASAATNFQLDLDSVDVLIAPNGIY